MKSLMFSLFGKLRTQRLQIDCLLKDEPTGFCRPFFLLHQMKSPLKVALTFSPRISKKKKYAVATRWSRQDISNMSTVAPNALRIYIFLINLNPRMVFNTSIRSRQQPGHRFSHKLSPPARRKRF